MASNAIPVDFVISDGDFSVTSEDPFVTISINNTLFPIQPQVGSQILVAQTFASPFNGLYEVTGVIPGGLTAVRITDVPYTVGTRFITRFNQIYTVVSNVGGVILIRAFDPSDPSLALLLRLVFGAGRDLCCNQQNACCEDDCGCDRKEKKEKKCVIVIKDCKKKHKKECKEKPVKKQKPAKKEKSCGCGAY